MGNQVGQFKVNFHPQRVIKGQALANFIAKFTYSNVAEVTGMANSTEAVKVARVRERDDTIPTKRDAE